MGCFVRWPPLRMMWDFALLFATGASLARPMAGPPCLSRDQEQRRARGLSSSLVTCRAPHLQNGSWTKTHRARAKSVAPCASWARGCCHVGVLALTRLASAAFARNRVICSHYFRAQEIITPKSQPAASPRAHDTFSNNTDTRERR
jgi:hypothetical protein